MTKIHSGGLRGPSVVAGPGVAYPPVPPLDGPGWVGLYSICGARVTLI